MPQNCCAGIPGEQRLTQLLDKPLFHMHPQNGTLPMAVRSKIKAVSGDTSAPGMGLSAGDKQRLVAEVDFVIHCAASISFFEPVQTLLEQNYEVSPSWCHCVNFLSKHRGHNLFHLRRHRPPLLRRCLPAQLHCLAFAEHLSDRKVQWSTCCMSMSPLLGVQATRQAATLALEMQHMRGFVHISTAYVNSNQARGSHVEERIYPLLDGCGARILHCDLAARLTALPAPKAEHLVTHCYSTVSGKLGPAQNGGLSAITSTTSTISSNRDCFLQP